VHLSSVEVIPYALPFKEPYVTARGVLQRREMVLLRVRDEDGVVGLGEAVPLALRGGVGLAEVVRELEGWAEVQATEGLSAPVRCAVETALADLRGRFSIPQALQLPREHCFRDHSRLAACRCCFVPLICRT